jgi:hypothetical protein
MRRRHRLPIRARSTDRMRWPPHRRVFVESIVAAVCAYILSAAFEALLIRSIGPTEWELAWVSDVALAGAFGTAVYLWRHLLTTRRELEARERAQLVVDTQLSIAADIQRQLLPPLPPNEYGFEWAAALRSSGTIGGDFYDFMPFGPTQLVVLVADVSGKGSRRRWRSDRCARRFARSRVTAPIPRASPPSSPPDSTTTGVAPSM